MTNLAILASHPIQYQAPLFRYLAKQDGVNLKTFFCSDFGVAQRKDEQFGVTFAWDIPLLDGYEYEFLLNQAKNPGPQFPKGLYNPDADKKILEFQPDSVLVHGYSIWTSRFVIDCMYHHDIPMIFRGESNLLQPRPLYVRFAKEFYLRNLFRKIGAFASIGHYNTEYYRHYGVSENRIHFAPYTVDNDFFQSRTVEARSEAERLRREHGILDRTVILFSGKFIAKKRPLELIEGFYWSGIFSDCVLVFAGDGEMKSLMEKRIADLGIASSVRFLGFRNQSQMPATYALGDLFVIPSSIEPWGLAVNEAMNLGRPIIASDMVSSARDLVHHGENGWVYPSGSVDRLAACLQEAVSLGREGLRVKGQRSLEIISRWGIPETVSGILDALRSII
jgi:glycosyltransferase involved in cell wall biosynthesis